jgi:hypothetical protein
MSTIRRLPRQPTLVIGQWLQAISPGDRHSAIRNLGQFPSRRHAVTAFAHVVNAAPANENREWEGGFDSHLGIYGRV